MANNFQIALNEYIDGAVKINQSPKMWTLFTETLKHDVENFLPKNKYIVEGSSGKGMKTFFPWIVVRTPKVNIAPGVKCGIYIAYLFRSDMKGFYLSLNQGMSYYDELFNRERYAKANQVSNYFREKINTTLFSKEKIDLASRKKGDWGYEYQQSNIVSKYYKSNNFTYSELKNDILELAKIYDSIIASIPKSYKTTVQDIVNMQNEMFGLEKGEEVLTKIQEAVDPNFENPDILNKNLTPGKPYYKRKTTFNEIANPPQKKVDWVAQASRDARTGVLGEGLVFKSEREALIKLNRPDLADKVEWVSKVTDALGYDIKSFKLDKNGREHEILIEVKTTSNHSDCPFPVSHHEVFVSEKNKNKYWVYRIYAVNSSSPKIIKTHGAIEKNYELDPMTYMAVLKTTAEIE